MSFVVPSCFDPSVLPGGSLSPEEACYAHASSHRHSFFGCGSGGPIRGQRGGSNWRLICKVLIYHHRHRHRHRHRGGEGLGLLLRRSEEQQDLRAQQREQESARVKAAQDHALAQLEARLERRAVSACVRAYVLFYNYVFCAM